MGRDRASIGNPQAVVKRERAAALASRSGMHRKGRHEYQGGCPSCGGNSRFHVNLSTGRFGCRGCMDGRDKHARAAAARAILQAAGLWVETSFRRRPDTCTCGVALPVDGGWCAGCGRLHVPADTGTGKQVLRAVRHGTLRRRRVADRDRAILLLRAQGATVRAIAESVGVSKSQVSNVCRRSRLLANGSIVTLTEGMQRARAILDRWRRSGSAAGVALPMAARHQDAPPGVQDDDLPF